MTSRAAPPRVELRRVTKVFRRGRERIVALGPIDLLVLNREFVSIVGPSGCGKSTLLNIVAGLEQPTSGEVLLDGQPAPERLGRVAYMHQRDLLLPWRRLVDNVVLPLELRGVPKHEARRRALPWRAPVGRAAFAEARIGPQDVDLAELYAPATIVEVLVSEA
ncbi:MAG: ATP-binding cassette domain-containing protein, partial [Thermomicrobium sp.]|nr:ATP-binding cassette domain-containing protein [Thermomicrobium sp.]